MRFPLASLAVPHASVFLLTPPMVFDPAQTTTVVVVVVEVVVVVVEVDVVELVVDDVVVLVDVVLEDVVVDVDVDVDVVVVLEGADGAPSAPPPPPPDSLQPVLSTEQMVNNSSVSACFNVTSTTTSLKDAESPRNVHLESDKAP
jgi:hypothetical protein